MKWMGILLLGLCAGSLAGAQTDDAESTALASLTITARQFAEQTGGRLVEEGLALAPGGRARCMLNFPTRQVCTFILMARGAAEPWPPMEIRLNTNLVYTGAAVSNWSSHAFTQVVAAGPQQLEIVNPGAAEPGARPTAIHIACLTITAPADVPALVVLTNAAAALVSTPVTTHAPVPPTAPASAATNPPPSVATNAVPVTNRWDVPVGR